MNRIKTVCITAAVLLVLCFSGCANQHSAPKNDEAKSGSAGFDAAYPAEPLADGHADEGIDPDLNTAIIAVEVSSITENAARETYPDAEYIYVNSAPDGFLAVQSGKADAFAVTADTFYSSTAAGHTGLRIHSDGVVGSPGKIAAVVSRATRIPNALQKMNDFLAELEADGTLDDMKRRWILEQNEDVPEIEKVEHPEYTIKIGTTGLAQPYTFYQNNELTGFDVELMQRFALWCNAELEIRCYNWEGIIPACASGNLRLLLTKQRPTETSLTTSTFKFTIPCPAAPPHMAVPSLAEVMELQGVQAARQDIPFRWIINWPPMSKMVSR